MKKYDVFFFDLDGTLTNPAEGITNSVEYALKHYGISVVDKKELLKFIGPPLKNSFMDFYNFSEEEAENAITVYREYFADKGIFENELYEGITQVLSKLKDLGKTVVLATSKPEKFAIRILKHFDIFKYFDYVFGATMDEKRCKKNDIIKFALSNIQAPIEKIVMIGDRCFDIDGAKENSIDSIAVSYGFGDTQELQEAKPNFIIDNPKQIFQFAE